MNTIRIMHFADTHFGVEKYGRVDPNTGLNTRIMDFRRSLEWAINTALDAGIDIALFAGDAYKTRDPSQTHQREFASCIRMLTDAGVPVVMVTGNHDLPNTKARANAIEIYRTLGVENVHIISRPEVIEVPTKSGTIQIAGMPYLLRSNVMSKDEFKNKSIDEIIDEMVHKYTTYIDYLAEKMRQDLPSVLLGHFWIKNAATNGGDSYLSTSEPEILLSNVANPKFDYVAMGHIHKYQNLNQNANPPVVYSGSIDRIDFGEAADDKGFVIADVAKGECSYRFATIPTRPFVDIEIDANCDDPTERIVSEIHNHDIKDAVVKIKYKVPQEKVPFIQEKEIRDSLSDAFMVVSIAREVIADRSTRHKLLNESLDPLQALEMYLDTRDDLRKRRNELIEYAKPLIEELLADEESS